MKGGVIRLLNEYGRVIESFHYSNIKERNKIIAAWKSSIAAYTIIPNT